MTAAIVLHSVVHIKSDRGCVKESKYGKCHIVSFREIQKWSDTDHTNLTLERLEGVSESIRPSEKQICRRNLEALYMVRKIE